MQYSQEFKDNLVARIPTAPRLVHPLKSIETSIWMEGGMTVNANVLKSIPYGRSDFTTLRSSHFIYVDKTRFIEALEDSGSLASFIVRPRRFGKTLFTQTLQAYYDKAAQPDFDRNFSGTYIGAHKTPLASSFHVLHLDFSGIPAESFEGGMLRSLQDGITSFARRYPLPGIKTLLAKSQENPVFLLSDFLRSFEEADAGAIYLVIDEHDHFANEILSSNAEEFRRITSTGGLLKSFYALLKARMTSGVIGRIFITGVTSLSLDSMTSGFNIASNFSWDPELAGMFGFTEEELRRIIPQAIDLHEAGRTLDEVVARMKAWYNGYRFSPDSGVTVFNPSMCLYYLRTIRRFHREPETLLDPAVSSDCSKIHGILKLGERQDVETIIKTAVSRQAIPFKQEPSILNLQGSGKLSLDGLLTALYYLGYLTYASGRHIALIMPNRAVAQEFFDVYFQYLRQLSHWSAPIRMDFAAAFASLENGNPRPLLEAAARSISSGCGTHKTLHLTESDFQTALLMAINFDDGYEALAELEVRGEEKGFIDLLLRSRQEGPSYLFELKHLSQGKSTQEAVARALAAAERQAARYAGGLNLQKLPNLSRVAAVYSGMALAAVKVF